MTPLPPHVTSFLRTVRRRTNRLRCGRALALVGIVSLAVLALAMAVDATVTIFDETGRWALTLMVYLVAFGSMLGALIALVRGRPTNTQLAQRIDARHPELQERLTTLVDVVTREAAGEETGASPALLALLAREADEHVAAYRARHEVPLARLVLWLLPLVALLLLFAGAYWARPKLVTCLAQRVLTPWVDTGNLYADQITVTPGDLTVLAGTNIVIAVQTTADFGQTGTLRISRWTGTQWDRERVSPMSATNTFETVADLAEPRWRYRVNCGPAVSRFYEVNVVPHPNYASFVATVAWPAYTGRTPSVVSNADVSVVRAVVGSAVTFAVTAPPGVRPAFALAGAQEVRAATNVWQWSMACAASNTVPWSLQMARVVEGFVEKVAQGRLETFVDAPPAVAVQAPQSERLTLPTSSPLPVAFIANDDFGLAAAELYVCAAGTTNRLVRRVLKLERLAGASRRMETTLDWDDLPLGGVRDLEIAAVVRDTRPSAFGGAQMATSMPIRVHLDDGAKAYTRQELDEMIARTKALYRDAVRDLEQAVNQANDLRQDVRREHGAFNEAAEKKLDAVTKKFESAQEKLNELLRELKPNEVFDPQREAMQQVQEQEMAQAAQQVQQAQPTTENPAERAQAANQMPQTMKEALDKMRPLEKQLEARASAAQQLDRLQSLADRQEKLAREAEARAQAPRPDAEGNAPQPQASESAQEGQQKWEKDEEALGHQTGKMSWRDDTPELAEASRQMHAAVRRARNEQKGRAPDESQQQGARKKAQQKLEEIARNLASARERREEAAQVEAGHEKSEAEAAQRLPYTEGERENLERLHHDAREHERRASQLGREAADLMMQAEADEGARQAMREATESLYQERKHAAQANTAFQQARWNKRLPAPKGENADLARELQQVADKMAAAEEAVKQGGPKGATEDGKSKEGSPDGAQKKQGSSASAARAAAKALQQAIERKRSELGMQQKPGESGKRLAPVNMSRMADGRVPPLPANLKGLISPEDWIRIRAVLGDAEAVDLAQIPDEYRDLVKRYFQILAGEH